MKKISKPIVVDSHHISCSGDDDVTGHPKIYLTINGNKNSINCPYCNKNFIFKS